MAVKDIMAELHQAVVSRCGTSAKYSQKIASPIKRAKLSEISIYNKFAEHCVENDIKPALMVGDLYDLFMKAPRNAFVIKTDDRFHWLRNWFNDLRWSDYDDKHFLCNQCSFVMLEKDRASALKACKPCATAYNKESARRATKKKKEEEIGAESAPEIITAEPVTELEVEVEIIPATIEPTKAEIKPFIRFSDLMTDTTEGKVTALLEVNLYQLRDLLEAIDPYLIKE